MNLRCAFCQTPYTIGRVEKLDALQYMDSNKLNHYDAHCPRCRRATPVPRQRLEMTMPNWRDALKELEAEMKANPQQEAPLPKPAADPAPKAEAKPAPVEKTKEVAKPKAKPAAKPAPAKKTATKKTTPKKTSAKKSK